MQDYLWGFQEDSEVPSNTIALLTCNSIPSRSIPAINTAQAISSGVELLFAARKLKMQE